MIKIHQGPGTKEMRMVVVDTINQLMEENKQIVALEADLGGASGFTKIHQNRLINVGIAEANMIGIASGLSIGGYIPYVHSFGPFITRRAFDQVFLAGGYAGTTIHMYGSDPGFCAGPNGGTHTTIEDIGLLRVIPNIVICDAADEVQMASIITQFSKRQGLHYVRANRKKVKQFYDEMSTFEIGKAIKLTEGDDVLLITCGQLVSDAYQAVAMLKENGIHVTLIDMFTIKPLDKACILKEMVNKKLIVTYENHSIINGLGSAIAEVMSESKANARLLRIGIKDHFGEVGTQEYLQAKYQLTAQDVVTQIIETFQKEAY